MQANKRNHNGWILCPSKSFPGKLYYFNVVNGEAAWSLSDVEKKSLKQDSPIQNIADKSHSFPEPDTPPLDDFTTSNICHQPANFTTSNICHQPPNYLPNIVPQRFGEPVFPKYFPSVATPLFWAPIQMVMPAEEKKIISSQVTRTFDPDCIVHSTDLPLSKRFSNPVFNVENKFENRFQSNKFCDTSTPYKIMTNQQINNRSVVNKTETSDIFKYPKIQPLKSKPRSNSESGISEVPFLFKNTNQNSTLSLPNRVKLNQSTFTQTPSWSVDNLSQSDKENPENQIVTKNISKSDKNVSTDNQKSTLKKCDKVDNLNVMEYNMLDSEDLRFLLVAKRRKSLDYGDLTEGKKLKSGSLTNLTPKKRVTFDLESLEDSESENNGPKYFEPIVEVKNPSIEQLRNLSKASMNKDFWYLVVDTEILLDNYEFIDQYVQSDVRCKLLIPEVVRSDIQIMSKGDCCGRHRIIVARQLCRRLAMPVEHVVLQSPDTGGENQIVTNTILNCCIATMKAQNRHVVLITNDTVLLKKAKTLSIHGYKLQDIKDGVVPTQKVSFDIKSNKKIHVNDDLKENLFLQNNLINDKNPRFKDLFSSKEVLDDKLINLTKPKHITQTNMKFAINYESDTIDSASEIGRNIKDINIKDNVKKSLFDNENQFEKLNFNNQSKSTKMTYMEEDIKRFNVKNKIMEDKIRIRIDEWICTFSQIMEDVLSDILLQNSFHHDMSPPWYLCEAVECIKVMYTQEPMIVSVINKLSILLFNCSCNKGKLKSNISAKDFMKILGYGMTLIQTLQDITPFEELKEAKNKLDEMLRTIEDPTVESDKEFKSPIVSRIDDSEVERPKRCNFQKKRSDIIQYLQKYFTQWKSYTEDFDIQNDDDEVQMNHQSKNPKVVRTFGRNLGLLKIDHAKNISMISPLKEPQSLDLDRSTKIEGPKVVRILNSNRDMCNSKGKDICATKKLQNEFNAQNHNNNDMPKLSKTFQTKEDETNGPKVIRNFGNLDRFSLKKNENQSKMLDNNKVEFRSVIPKRGNTFKVAEEKNDGPKVIRAFKNDDNFSFMKSANKCHKNNTGIGVAKRDLKTEPKVVINMKLIDVFEEKLMKEAKELNMDELDYEDSLSTIKINHISQSMNNCDDEEENNNDYYLDHDTSPQIHKTQNKYLQNNEILTNKFDSKTTKICTTNENNQNSNTTVTSVFFNNENQHTNFASNNDTSDMGFASLRDDSTNDSGFENESLQAYSLAKSFLTEISSSFKTIYKFIDKSINEVRDEELQEDKKKILQNKANTTHLHIAQVIEKLKSIIERESNDDKTLKSYLIKGDVSGDKRMSRYRQVVSKSLEQAQLLEKALKLMLNIIDNDFVDHSSLSTDNVCNKLKYYNIFK